MRNFDGKSKTRRNRGRECVERGNNSSNNSSNNNSNSNNSISETKTRKKSGVTLKIDNHVFSPIFFRGRENKKQKNCALYFIHRFINPRHKGKKREREKEKVISICLK